MMKNCKFLTGGVTATSGPWPTPKIFRKQVSLDASPSISSLRFKSASGLTFNIWPKTNLFSNAPLTWQIFVPSLVEIPPRIQKYYWINIVSHEKIRYNLDFENLFSNGNSHIDYLWQVSSKCPQLSMYRVMWNVLMNRQCIHGWTADPKTSLPLPNVGGNGWKYCMVRSHKQEQSQSSVNQCALCHVLMFKNTVCSSDGLFNSNLGISGHIIVNL